MHRLITKYPPFVTFFVDVVARDVDNYGDEQKYCDHNTDDDDASRTRDDSRRGERLC